MWFVRRLLRAHGYHPSTLEPLKGQPLSSIPPQAGDVVVPKHLTAESMKAKNPMESVVGRVVLDQVSVEKDEVIVESIHPAFNGASDSRSVTLSTQTMAKDNLVYTTMFCGSGTDASLGTEKMSVDAIPSEESTEGTPEPVSNKIQSDLAGVVRLDGSALESVMKECKKNSETLANLFSAGLPDALLKATGTAERQMQSLEPREDLPERISAVGSLTLYIAEQLFSDKPRPKDCTDSKEELSMPNNEESHQLSQRNRHGSSQSTNSAGQSNRRSANASVSAEQDLSSASNLVASLQQRRGLLLSLMSRSRAGSGDGAGADDALNPLSDDLFFSRLPIPPPGFYGAGDRAALLMGGNRDASNRHIFETASRSNNNHRSTSERNASQDTGSGMPTNVAALSSRATNGNNRFLESVLRSNSSSAKSVVPSNTMFFQHIIRVGLWSNSAAWIKAALDKHIKKSPQKTSSILKQAYDEEGTPILKLAVTFGCSADVVGLLLSCGAHITSSDVYKAVETNQAEVLSLFLRHTSLPSDIDVSSCSDAIKAVVEEARERQDRLDKKMRESAGEFMVELLKRLVNIGLIARRHRTARLDSCSRSISEILVGNVLLRALQQSQATDKKDNEPDPSEESMTGRFSVEERLESHPACGLFGSLPESILGEALFGSLELATNTLLLLEDFLCSKDMVDSSAGLSALYSLLSKFPSLRTCAELKRFGMLELVSFHDALASSRCTEAPTHASSESDGPGLGHSGDRPGPPGLVLCPKKHTAVLHITRHSSFRCDLCGHGVERGRIMHGCRECDWDACEECTDKAESGIVKCSAIREIACSCRDLLTANVKEEPSELTSEKQSTYLKVISEIGNKSAWNDVENVSVRLLQYDRRAIRDLAQMLRTPGAITIHQFQNLILPALHVACVGREDRKESGGGHKNKKAKVASQEYSGEAKDIRNPEERTGFNMELVRAMILEVDETPRKRESVKLPGSETNSVNESEDGDEGSGESETEQRQIVNEREIAFFAEASELLRRLQQVLSLYENVHVSSITWTKRSGANADMQSLTKPIEIHLRPSSFVDATSYAPSKLVLNSEPLVAFDDIKRHVLRCCGTMDSSYKDFCRRYV